MMHRLQTYSLYFLITPTVVPHLLHFATPFPNFLAFGGFCFAIDPGPVGLCNIP